MSSKKFLLLMGIFSLLVAGIAPAQAQSLPTVEVWVTVRDGSTQEEITDATVTNSLCGELPPDSCFHEL